MSEAPTTAQPVTPTELETRMQSLQAFFTRLKGSTRAAQPVTQGQLSSFVLDEFLPLLSLLRGEYNEGFDAVSEAIEESDDDEDEGDYAELVVAGKVIIAELVVFSNVLLSELKWLDPATGGLVAGVPPSVRDAFDALLGRIAAFDSAAADVTVDDDEDDGEEGEAQA